MNSSNHLKSACHPDVHIAILSLRLGFVHASGDGSAGGTPPLIDVVSVSV